jgi:hypothetical protein
MKNDIVYILTAWKSVPRAIEEISGEISITNCGLSDE